MVSEWRVTPDDWPDAVADTGGPQLVVAGPGAGKTEFLVRRALYLVDEAGVPPERLLLLSFSRRSASDLRSRVQAGLGRSFTTVPASTFHSLAHRLLEVEAPAALGWGRMPTLLTGPEHVALVGELLAGEDPGRWPLPLRDLLGTVTFAEEVRDFLLRCQEQLVGPEALAVKAADRADWRALPGFFSHYLAALEERGRIDYGTLQAQAVRLLDRPGVLSRVAAGFSHVLVDEYQDTTVAQAALLQRLYRPHRNLTVAGDPYQSIYSFRGAELHNTADFPAAFTALDGAPARRLVLTTSFRVPQSILDAAVRVTAGGDLPGAAGPVTPAPGQGSVETYVFDQQSHEAEWIAAELQRTHLLDATPYRRMAVLVRTKRRLLPELSRALERRGIPHDRPDTRLADHPAVRMMLDVVVAATRDGSARDRAMRRLLLGPLFALPLGQVLHLERERARGGDWAALLTDVPGGTALAGLLHEPGWAATEPAADGFWALWSRLPHLPGLVAAPGRREDRAAWSSLSQALGRLRERDPAATLADYLRWAQEEDFEATPLLGFRPPDEDRLTLTTLHQAKGLEFDVVVVADAVEGVFPDLRPRESLLGARHLSPSQPADPAGYARFRLQEEMRLAYTAMGRARRRVVWTATAAGLDQGEGAPSRFLPLVAGAATVAGAAGPPGEPAPSVVTPLEAEAALRRTLRDPGAGEAARLAALDALGRGPRWRLRPIAEFGGVRARGDETGLVGDDHRLSPSQVQAYVACPRRYAFERRLHVGDQTSVYSAFGTAVHDVLESAERAALARGGERSTLDDALAALGERWDPAPFGGGAWAEGWRRHAERTLRHLYACWPGKGKAVALEHPLELEMDGVLWHGRADRNEVYRKGAVRIVDYKTSKSPAGVEEAAVSVQLAFYLLAARADPAVTAHGRPAEAEFWYPARYDRKSVATRRLDPSRLDEVREVMRAAGEGIRAEQWRAAPGPHCQSCRVRLVCPAWPEGREAYGG